MVLLAEVLLAEEGGAQGNFMEVFLGIWAGLEGWEGVGKGNRVSKSRECGMCIQSGQRGGWRGGWGWLAGATGRKTDLGEAWELE